MLLTYRGNSATTGRTRKYFETEIEFTTDSGERKVPAYRVELILHVAHTKVESDSIMRLI